MKELNYNIPGVNRQQASVAYNIMICFSYLHKSNQGQVINRSVGCLIEYHMVVLITIRLIVFILSINYINQLGQAKHACAKYYNIPGVNKQQASVAYNIMIYFSYLLNLTRAQ